MASLRLTPASGASIEITRDGSVVGRDPSCEIVLPDGSISRKHARLERRGDSWMVVDQGSANGTFIDSQRVAEATLRSGQELRFGAMSFRVETEEEAGATVIGMLPEQPTAVSSEPQYPRAPGPPPAPRTVPLPPPPPPRSALPPPPPPRPASAPLPPGRSASPVPQMAAPLAAPKKKSPWLWVGIGCCGCLLLLGLVGGGIALFGGGLFGAVLSLTEAPMAAVQAELTLLRGGDDDAAYAALAESYRSELTPAAFAELVSKHPGLRGNSGFTASNRSVENDTATISGELQSLEGSREPAAFRLRNEGGTWRITAIEISGLSE